MFYWLLFLFLDFLLKILHGTNSTSSGHLKERLYGKSSKDSNILMYKLTQNIYGCLCPPVDIAASNGMLEKVLRKFKWTAYVLYPASF